MVIKFLTRNGLYLILAVVIASFITMYYNSCGDVEVTNVDSTVTADSTVVDTINFDTVKVDTIGN